MQIGYGRSPPLARIWIGSSAHCAPSVATGKAKEQWGKLTDDELTQINGNREQLEGKIQAKYGYAKDKAKQEVDDWCNRL